MATRSLTNSVVGASTTAWFVKANRQRSEALSYFLDDFADCPHTRLIFEIGTPETPEGTNPSHRDCSVTVPPLESIGRDF
jgi:hypothetical protein